MSQLPRTELRESTTHFFRAASATGLSREPFSGTAPAAPPASALRTESKHCSHRRDFSAVHPADRAAALQYANFIAIAAKWKRSCVAQDDASWPMRKKIPQHRVPLPKRAALCDDGVRLARRRNQCPDR